MARTAPRLTPAYVLHSHDWSESSLILDLFTREQGRVVAVAKGAKRPYSQLRPVLLPFQRLLVGFGGKRGEEAEVALLRHAEWAGGPAWPGGAALLPGFYLNELLTHLLVRHEPQVLLFEAYAQTLVAMTDPALLQAALRAFELVLLRQVGHLPDLAVQTLDNQPVQDDVAYELTPDQGAMPLRGMAETGHGPVPLAGQHLLALEAALRLGVARDDGGAGMVTAHWLPELMAACLPVQSELKAIGRQLIHYHLGTRTLRTRQLMMELQQP